MSISCFHHIFISSSEYNL